VTKPKFEGLRPGESTITARYGRTEIAGVSNGRGYHVGGAVSIHCESSAAPPQSVRPLRILVLGTFVDNLLVSKAQPIASLWPEVQMSWLVDHPCQNRQVGFSYPRIQGMCYETVPKALQVLLGRNLGKLTWAAVRSFHPGYDVYFSFYIWPHGITLFLINLLHGLRLNTVHFLISGSDELKARQTSPSGIRHFRVFAPLLEWMLIRVLRSFSVVAAKGSQSRQYLEDRGVRDVSVFPGSIDVGRFTPAPEHAKDVDVISVGRIDKRKNLETLVRATEALLGRYPSLRVTIVGKEERRGERFSPSQRSVEELVNRLGLSSHITLVPMTDRVEELYRRARVYVQTSVSEGLSTSLREALACGVPAVASDVGDTSDVVGESKGGILVGDCHSGEEFARGVDRLLCDPDLRSLLGAQGRRLILEGHSVERERELYRELLSRLAGNNENLS
jgi:L-malate glycosyltransferase